MSSFIPNSFQVPNAFVDEVMCQIGDVAAKLYLIICRKTRGWYKEVDSISLSQFQKISGKSRPTITKALAELIQVGLVIECESTVHGNSFKLNDDCTVGWMLKVPSKKSLLVKKFNHTSKKSLLLLVKNFYTQKTLSKDTLQNKKINKKSKSTSEQPKAEKPTAFEPKTIELPVNVNRDLWIQFVDMRNSIKKPLTENAVNLLIKKLIGFGECANQSLEASIIGSYQSVYPPKQQTQVQNQPQTQRRRFGSQASETQMRTVVGVQTQ